MTKNDLEALKLAMQIAGQDEARRQQLQSMLRNRSWYTVAEFAAYGCQFDALGLRLWQQPPCHLSADQAEADWDQDTQRLLKRMLKLGISRYHPDPAAALAAATRRM